MVCKGPCYLKELLCFVALLKILSAESSNRMIEKVTHRALVEGAYQHHPMEQPISWAHEVHTPLSVAAVSSNIKFPKRCTTR